ncbi:MAG: alpha-1,2-fucosyltransferase [Patescibacteria group bacterium]|nr:alpha-1,2-fucosyltransferase [bacterium]MDZ4240711.1 alpha-1,2-fucosyltransferase [Patescibacteria group bacterium]
MIIVNLIGGLGNQLFQYAVGKRVALVNQTELKLDISGFETYKLHAYSLQHFNIVEQIATSKEVAWFKKYQKKKGRIWFLYNRLIANDAIYIQERGFPLNQKVMDLKSPAYLDGYWQTEKYFKQIEDIIRKEFTVKDELTGRNKEVAEEIKKTSSVSLHVRRADYVTNARTNEHHGTCDSAYYNKAVSIIAEKVETPHFFVFSDDMDWAKKNIILNYPITYVDHNSAATNYEDLRLMSLCKHNIIANSSFSWWGAWLNNNPQKTIIAPQRWFLTDKMDTRDLIPNTWIKI